MRIATPVFFLYFTALQMSCCLQLGVLPHNPTRKPSITMVADDERLMRITKLEEMVNNFDAATDDHKAFSAFVEDLARLKMDGLEPGSSAWAAVVVVYNRNSKATSLPALAEGPQPSRLA